MVKDNNYNYFMQLALEEAKISSKNGEVPVGAISVLNGKVLVKSGNEMENNKNPLYHAEILVLLRSAKILYNLGQPIKYKNLDLYVTLEPCPMCAHAISLMRINNLYYGADDFKSGGVKHGPKIFEQRTCHHKPVIHSGILRKESEKLIKNFFIKLRKK